MGRLDGKVAIVTGASRQKGMGAAIALGLAEAGADVVVTGRSPSPEAPGDDGRTKGWRGVDSVAEEIRTLGRRALPLRVDIAETAQVQAMVQEVLAKLGRIDILVNNAAADIARDRVPVVELADDAWEAVLRVNLTGTFLCSKYAAQAMIRQGRGGKIVNISSVHGRRGEFQRAAYCASKFGLLGFTQALAQELGAHHINVNAVCPGIIDTDRTANWGGLEARRWGISLEEARTQWLRAIPLGRRGTIQDVANAVVFLASDQSDYITGQALNVCGGRFMN